MQVHKQIQQLDNPYTVGIAGLAGALAAATITAFVLWRIDHGTVVIWMICFAAAHTGLRRHHRARAARRHRAAQAAARAAENTTWHHEITAAISDPIARTAVGFFRDPDHIPHLWAPLRLGSGTHPVLLGVQGTVAGARVHLLMPPSHPRPADYAPHLPALAHYLGVDELAFHSARGDTLTLEILDHDDDPADPTWHTFLHDFHPRLHHALTTLFVPHRARRMWSELGLGAAADPRTGTPAAYPSLIAHAEHPGVHTIPVGARVTLAIPTGWAPSNFQTRLGHLATALDIPEIRIAASAAGKRITLELRVVDPIDEVVWSPLISVHEAIDPDGRVITSYRPLVRPGELSCHDDIALGPNEHGHMMVHNLAEDGHLVLGGGTRTGKSITLNNIIAAAILMRDTKVVVIDPNGAATPPWYQLLHLVCEDNDGDAAAEVLEEVIAEIERRKPLFHRLKIANFTVFSEELPLWVVAIDEAANFRKHTRLADLLAKVASQSLKYGIVLVISLQQVSEYNLPTAVRTNMTNRLTHRVNDAQDYRMLFPTAPEYIGQVTSRAAMAQGVAIASLSCHPDPIRMRSLFLPTQACFAIADMILQSRGPLREPPYSEHPDGPDEYGETTSTATDSRIDGADHIVQLDDFRGLRRCAAPNCTNPVPQAHTGRPGKYCSPRCRQIAHRHRNRTRPTGEN